MKGKRHLFTYILAILLSAGLVSCSGGSSFSGVSNPGGGQAAVAIFGQDAPLASVLSFQITITGITASDGVNTTVLLNTPQTVEFAKLTGLRTLLDLNSAPVGTYTSVTVTLMNPVISYINVTNNAPPAVTTITGTLTTSSFTMLLNPPLVLTDGDLNGLRLDFDLRQSLQLDVNGQITGTVVSTFDIRQVAPNSAEAEVDNLYGGVLSTNTGNGSFVMQLPNGRMLTVQTDSSTILDNGDDLTTLNSNTIVEVSGELNRVTRNLDATEVSVLSQDHFILGGLITNFQPSTGPATQFDLFVREELPAIPNIQPDSITTFGLTGSEKFLIHHLNMSIAQLLFNSSSMVLGQHVTVGGALNASPTVHRVVLHQQGIVGLWVPGSTVIQSGNNGSFMINEGGLVGLLMNAPLKVLTSNKTEFIGLSGLGGLSGTQAISLRIAGLLLKDPATGNPVFLAHRVEMH
jgi:hypothetical protein